MKDSAFLIVCLGILAVLGGAAVAVEAPREAAGSPRLSALLGSADPGFARALEPREFAFPADHGPHPEYRNEWWYVTGNLDAATGERFGFELTIFRFALAPATEPAPVADETSAWRTRQVYVGHFAVTDVSGRRFLADESFARGALGLAGAAADPFRVWVEDWFLKSFPKSEQAGGKWLLHADSGHAALTLTLQPLKPPVLQGDDGLSRKSFEPGNASYYYSITRIATDGALRIGREVYDVSGLSWLDREWGSSALSDEQAGWDWFALQLADGSELMYYQLRRRDGSIDPMSAGTFVPAEGAPVHLTHEDMALEVRDYWTSPQGGRYPSAWTLAVPKLALTAEVEPVMAAQELDTSVRYWEGAVDVSGRRGARELTGRGYVELTGYAHGP
ncbi:MAG TPA: lipocalin-like domain-containing protein [Woeseiaceae bacterium]|nr:lipocalin-like domain-containing protein [Woeseiaceae bacterium]